MRGVLVDCGACPYLPDRQFHAFQPDPAEAPLSVYRQLMDVGFRRSGPVMYLPHCPGCRACQPLRVDATRFAPRRDQRRCARRNADLVVTFHARGLDAERNALYTRYQAAIHAKADDDTGEFLTHDGGVSGGELHARDANGRLLAVSVVDRFSDALSSVYCYHDPDHRERGLGTFMALAELAFCRQHALQWLYLGFYVAGCQKMVYKARFQPCQILVEGRWETRDAQRETKWDVPNEEH